MREQKVLEQKQEEKILKQYSDLIYKLSFKYNSYYNGKFCIDDLYQEARLSALKAIRSYDKSKKTKLITHIYNHIMFGFGHYARNETGIIKIPAKTNTKDLPKIIDNDFLYNNSDNECSYVHSQDFIELDEYLSILTDKQKSIIHKAFVLGYTYDEIAKENNVTRQAISQTINISLKKIRNKFENTL